MEQEANQFALCLLMPENMFVSEWIKLTGNNQDEEKIPFLLAKIFEVPYSACVIRMAQLGKLFDDTRKNIEVVV